MKRTNLWNRRDFIAKPAALLVASKLFGGSEFLLGESKLVESTAPNANRSDKLITRTLGKTGITLPIVSMGVMNADISGLLRRCYEVGIRHFDTAAVYQQGRNEEMIGTMIKEMGVRDNVIIATKAGRPGRRRGRSEQPEPPAQSFTTAETKTHYQQVLDGSLKRLQMDHVEILYNHGCDNEADLTSEAAIEALSAIKQAGKARFIGVSSHSPEMALKQAMRLGVYDVVLIQFNYTMANDASLIKTMDEAAKMGIGIIAMKTQAGGINRPDPKLGKPLTMASQAALLKWALRHESVTTAIPGYTAYGQIDQSITVASNLNYTPEELEFISDKKNVADAQFCHQCGQCRADCPLGIEIPQLMRSHMYTVQYGNHALAAEILAAIPHGKGLVACDKCETCKATCRNSVNIAQKIQLLKEISSIGRFGV